jgi:hypothetical protein
MLGTKLYKGKYTNKEYADLAVWCNANNATIEDKGEYYECVEIPAHVPTEKEIQEQLEQGIEAWMNTVVAERDYDSIDTCIARYTDSPNPKYAREAKAVRDWNTAVWDKCWDILAEVKAGKRDVPTLEEVIAELPKLDWGDEAVE